MRASVLAMFCIFAVLCGHIVIAEDAFVGKPGRIDPGTGNNRFVLEFSAVARNNGEEVIALWMKRPAPEGANDVVTRRIYSDDYGISWFREDFDRNQNREVDPMSAHDPGSKNIWVGGKGGSALWVSKVPPNPDSDDPFDPHVDAFLSGGSGINPDRPTMTAGPRPDTGATRIYIHAAFGSNELIWSDDSGANWTSPADINSGIAIEAGDEGRFYTTLSFQNNLLLRRSIELVSGVPSFLTDASDGAAPNVFSGNWLPGDFRKVNYQTTCSSPLDSRKVYVVWVDRSDEDPDENGNWNVDLFFRRTDDATATNVTWEPTSDRVIVPADEPGKEPIPGDQFFQWLEVTTFDDGTGPTERLHLLWMDSRLNPDQSDAGNGGDEHALLDAWYAYSDDQGDSWTQFRLTRATFDVEDAGPPVVDVPFYGDYVGMAASGKRIFPFYAIAGDPDGLQAAVCEAFMNYIVFGTAATQNSYSVTVGTQTSGSANALQAADETPTEDIVAITPASPSPTSHVAEMTVVFTHDLASGEDNLDLRVETAAMAAGTISRIKLKDWTIGGGTWVEVRMDTFNDTVQHEVWARGLDPAKYIRSSDDRIEMQLRQEFTGTFPSVPTAKYDFAQVIVVDNP